MSGTYDRYGHGYAGTRRPDPRVEALIHGALDGMTTVANIGAGTGSYEPGCTPVAVEPSRVMVRQRPVGAAPAILARAEDLPLADRVVDAALAVLTIHHWEDLDRGLRELRRIARRRVVILSWDPDIYANFWLVRDYLPAAGRTDRGLAVPIERVEAVLGDVRTQTVPVPHDCVDGFGAA